MSIYTKDLFVNDPDTKIGDYTYGNISVGRSYSGCKLEIGKFCSLGSGIQAVFWGKHQMNDITTYPFNMLHSQGWPPVNCTEVKGEDIYIGNDVWIANNVLIMQGAYISDGAVIGAHAIVGGHVEPYSVVVGNPAKEIKKRFDDYYIRKLMTMEWWNWPIDIIKKNLQIINSPNINRLYEIWEAEIK